MSSPFILPIDNTRLIKPTNKKIPSDFTNKNYSINTKYIVDKHREVEMWFLEAEEQVFLSKNNITDECKKCGHKHAQYREKLIFARAAFVPVFPIKVSCVLHCNRCSRSTTIPNKQRSLVPTHAIALKFIGLTLICFALVYAWQSHQASQFAQQKLLQAPKVHDFYFIDKNNFHPQANMHFAPYQVAKVVAVNKTYVTLRFGNYQYKLKSGLVKAIRSDYLMASDYFSKNTESIPLDQFTLLVERGAIYEAHRPAGVSLYGGIVMKEQRVAKQGVKKVDPVNAEAIRLYHQGDFIAAFDLFKKSAQLGNGWAQYNLAQMYRDGEGITVNFEQARYWFEMAKAQGIPVANSELSDLGIPVSENANH